ncbi:hypothetical protein N0V95_000597 [Ascochyta clinopodiicola]|nr:hypothetical protein N0V95_000597 [Ascochyta clinopodiicola]
MLPMGRGTTETEEALYEVSAGDSSEPAAKEKRAKAKSTTATKTKTTAAKTTRSKAAGITSEPSPKVSPTKPSGPKISSKPSGSKASSIKPTGSKTSSKVSGSATPSASACPLPRKGKNGKPLQRRCAGDEFYSKRDFIPGKVTHWKFNTMKEALTYNADANAKSVLIEMSKNAQMDVVKVSSGDLTVVGNVNDPDVILATKRGTDPDAFMKKGGNYLLTNGGFFQHLEMRAGSFEPAGEDTMVKTADGTVKRYAEPFPVPEAYAPFYDQIDGLEGTKVHSGPDLKKTIPEIDAKAGVWKYDSNDPNIVGRLSHASESNERIALVRFGRTYYIVAYTCKARECGVNTNKLKKIIDIFFSKMGETGKSISSSTQAVCLDGGPSISMTWNTGSTMEKLSLGGAGDLTPAPGTGGRKVSNLIKIVAK